MSALLPLACGSPEKEVAEDVADAPREPCGPARIQVTAVPPDSFTVEDRCALVGLAVTMLGSAGEETGLLPSDTAAAMTALLVPMVERDGDTDTVIAARWHVSLDLRGRPYNAELMVDRRTGTVRISRMHK
ncbi:MAG TPA: hypothetical protein VLK84_30110 [Longimicrobium sp.]|nr:hypothetical protein [Longimicrobium sp.]